jgi:hypothetical protein
MSRTLYPPPGSIKSIQRGTGTCATDVTITAINLARSELRLSGWSRGGVNPCEVRAWLSNSTTIASAGNDTTATFAWEVTERY